MIVKKFVGKSTPHFSTAETLFLFSLWQSDCSRFAWTKKSLIESLQAYPQRAPHVGSFSPYTISRHGGGAPYTLRHPFLKVSLLAFDALPEYPLRAQRNGFGRARFAKREVSVLSKQLGMDGTAWSRESTPVTVSARLWTSSGSRRASCKRDEDSRATSAPKGCSSLRILDPRQKPTCE